MSVVDYANHRRVRLGAVVLAATLIALAVVGTQTDVASSGCSRSGF